MPNNCLADDVNKEFILSGFDIDWPYERVTVQAKVISDQTQNIFRWAVIRILEDFREDVPSLEEAADQLGIKDAVFLKEALESLTAEGTVEKIDSERDLDFPNCRIAGYDDNNQTQHSEAQLHGFTLLFDAVTGRYVPPVTDGTEVKPANPVISPDELTALREQISLEKARNLARIQHEPFLDGQSRIIDVRVNPDMSSVIWQPVKAAIVIDQAGTIRCRLNSDSQDRQGWINGLDFDHRVFRKALDIHIDRRFYPPAGTALCFEQWQNSYQSVVEPGKLLEKVLELISSAKTDILIDAYWINFAPVRQAVSGAPGNNVTITICTRDCQLPGIPEQLISSADIAGLGDYPRVLLIADGSSALSVDQVTVHTSQKKKWNVIVPSLLKPDCALKLRHELMEQKITATT